MSKDIIKRIDNLEIILRELFYRMGDNEDLSKVGYDLLEKLDSQGKTECKHEWVNSVGDQIRCDKCDILKTEKKEFIPKLRARCLQCKTEPDLLQDCENKDRWYCPQCDYEWNKKKASGGEYPPEFICRCGKRFVPYHDGLEMQTGFCADCLTKYDTVGLDDLGSEKTDLGNECPKEDDALSKFADSKPPEPNRTVLIDEKICITCNLDLTNEPRLEVHMCGECADKIVNEGYKLEERVRGGTGQEPREDEPYATFKCTICGSLEIIDENDYFRGKVVVKREKIEFWRKELLNKTDEVLKSMREVLGIE